MTEHLRMEMIFFTTSEHKQQNLPGRLDEVQLESKAKIIHTVIIYLEMTVWPRHELVQSPDLRSKFLWQRNTYPVVEILSFK